jgi:hypothetical protein
VAARRGQIAGTIAGREEVVAEDLLESGSVVGDRVEQLLDERLACLGHVAGDEILVGCDAHVCFLERGGLERWPPYQHRVPVEGMHVLSIGYYIAMYSVVCAHQRQHACLVIKLKVKVYI